MSRKGSQTSRENGSEKLSLPRRLPKMLGISDIIPLVLRCGDEFDLWNSEGDLGVDFCLTGKNVFQFSMWRLGTCWVLIGSRGEF